jgi:hypothetical protein
MERLTTGTSSDGADDNEPLGPRHTHSMPISRLPEKEPTKSRDNTTMSLGPLPRRDGQNVVTDLPSPWHPEPREFIVGDSKNRKPALTGVFGVSGRPQRASSMGENALKRLSKAFDSMNLPTFSSPSFFSSRDDRPGLSPTALAHRQYLLQKAPVRQIVPSSDAARDSLALRRSNSEDSTLYHSLSRVSSFGDDDRFTHIREQVNVRLKAIKDSWDAPTFKLPSNSSPDFSCDEWTADSVA